MVTNLGGWIHNFTVTDAQTHKAGFTIYKITSIIFPRSVPQALTCVTVWKRFHEVKRLHRELSRRHKSLQLAGRLPEPTDSTYFKRFNAEVIHKRKEYILQFLDVIAQHPALYKCHAFTQFFSVSESPASTPKHLPLLQIERKGKDDDGQRVHAADGRSITEICDKLEALCDKDEEGQPREAGHADNTINAAVEPICDAVAESKSEAATNEDTNDGSSKDYSRFLTPMASIESDDSDYIYEAALEFSHAVQAEVNMEFKDAHTRYKRGVELLLNGSKDDTNEERKFIAKAKILKYLARADEIFEKMLADAAADSSTGGGRKSNFQLSIDVSENASAAALYIERPWNNLVKYKVLQVLGESVLQVQSITEPQRPIYVLKGIEKPSSNSPTQTIFLPQHIPYMVDLVAFFQNEQKVFLLLREAEGGRLYDYIRNYKAADVGQVKNYSDLFPQEMEVVQCTKPDETDNVTPPVESAPAMLSLPDSCEVSELMECSQKLLNTVTATLRDVERAEEAATILANEATVAERPTKEVSTRLPEASFKHWACELAVAIHSLHSKGVILGDLHMDNLLLGSMGHLLLTYFYQNEGVTGDDGQPHQYKAFSPKAVRGHFVAPERRLTTKSDWWSYGVILYEFLVGVPFREAHPGRIEMYGYVQYPDAEAYDLSDEARDLLENLLQLYPDERFDFNQICGHAFFEGVQWDEVRRNGMNAMLNRVYATSIEGDRHA